MSQDKLFQVGVKALIENEEGKILLLYAPGWEKAKTEPHWDIPGGRIKEGQSIKETLKREVEEETGIKNIKNSKFFASVISKHEIPQGDRMLGLVLMAYRVRIPDTDKIVLSDEHEKYEWVDKKEAARRLANKYPEEFTGLLANE